MNYRMFRSVLFAGLLGAGSAGWGIAHGGEVRDDAGLFTPQAVQKANAAITKLESETPWKLTIETVAALPDGKGEQVSKMSARERDKFFDDWARERAVSGKVRGIYVAITKQPGHVQVEVDRKTREAGFGAKQRDLLRDKFVDGFKKKEFDQGLLEGVDYVRYSSSLHAGNAGRARAPAAAPHQPAGGGAAAREIPSIGGMSWFGWAIVIGVVFLVIRLVGGLFRMLSGGSPAPGAGGMGGGGFGGGGLFGSLLTGMFGAMAGHWLYDSFFSGHHGSGSAFGGESSDRGAGGADDGAGQDFEGSGGDFGDSGSGGDAGGGDFGGGDFGGGDFGGGDFGGGDF